jgi:TetR/AcrR family transcriptional repressor of nem operon
VGVPKGPFYHYFGSKAEFGLALVDAYAVYFANKLDRWFLDEASRLWLTCTPLSKTPAPAWRFDYRRGCLVGNLGEEISALARDRLASVFADWEARSMP